MPEDEPAGDAREHAPAVLPGIDADWQWSNFEASLAATLEQLCENQYLIVSFPWSDYYVQFAGEGADGIFSEAVSSTFIEGIGRLLGPGELKKLADLGWADPRPPAMGTPNYSRLWPPPVEWQAIARTAVGTLREVYHIGYPGALRYKAFTKDGIDLRFPALGLKLDGEPDLPPLPPLAEGASQVPEQAVGGRPGVLVYRVREDGLGVVFASEDEALEISMIHDAMLNARTWGDFEAMMPPDEYKEVRAALEIERNDAAPSADEVFGTGFIPCDDNGDYPGWVTQEILDTSWTWGDFRRQAPPEAYDEVVRAYLDQEIPFGADDALWLGSFYGSWTDGDYPTWLQQEMLSWFPEDIIEKFGGTVEESILNGPFVLLPPEHADEIADELRKKGYVVEHRPDLGFY